MVTDLVSIITPCYGTAKYLPNLLQSILKQTYPKIELFVIDDGSPDDIECVVKQFEGKFVDKGYNIRYVRQINSGQSVAIQNGLSLVKGEYLVWPDSDDFYSSEMAIAKMVERLKSLPDDFAMVRTQQIVVDDSPLHKIITIQGLNGKIREEYSFFEDCMFQKNSFYFGAGAYMVKTEILLESTELPIYTEKNAGQNWQLLLPVLYKHRCSTILEPLYSVVARTNSHSRISKSSKALKNQILSYKNTLLGTLDRIKEITSSDLNRYRRLINNHYLLNEFHSSIANKNGKLIDKLFWRLIFNRGATPNLCIKYISYRIGIYKILCKHLKSYKSH